MADFPSSIKVGPYDYAVHVSAEKIAAVRNAAGSVERIGNISYAQLEITIDPFLAKGRLVSTLLHEVLHACLQITFKVDDKIDDETIVSGLTDPLLGVLRDNPALVAYLTEA